MRVSIAVVGLVALVSPTTHGAGKWMRPGFQISIRIARGGEIDRSRLWSNGRR
jgi:hypothetical protein